MALDPKLLEILACPEDKGPLLYFADESTLYNPRLQAALRRAGRHPDHADRRGRDGRRRRSTSASTAKAEADGIQPTFDGVGAPRWRSTRSTSSTRSAALPEQLAAAHEAPGRSTATALPDADDVRPHRHARHGRLRHRRRHAAGGRHRDAAGAGHRAEAVPHAGVRRRPRTLAFALSYSGDTEETVAMARGALAAGARLVAISRGGELARARAASTASLHVPCPDGILMPRPRSARWSRRSSSCCSAWACCPRRTPALLHAQEQLAHRRDQCKPTVEGDAQPRPRARAPDRPHDPAHLRRRRARRGRGDALEASVNENAKAPAFWNAYPELDHNEICGWGQHGDVTRQLFTLVELRHGFEHARLEQRFAAHARDHRGGAACRCSRSKPRARAGSRSSSTSCTSGDWTSCYLALDNDVDPGPIDAIEPAQGVAGLTGVAKLPRFSPHAVKSQAPSAARR